MHRTRLCVLCARQLSSVRAHAKASGGVQHERGAASGAQSEDELDSGTHLELVPSPRFLPGGFAHLAVCQFAMAREPPEVETTTSLPSSTPASTGRSPSIDRLTGTSSTFDPDGSSEGDLARVRSAILEALRGTGEREQRVLDCRTHCGDLEPRPQGRAAHLASRLTG